MLYWKKGGGPDRLTASDLNVCPPQGPDLAPKLILSPTFPHQPGGAVGSGTCEGRAPSAGRHPLSPGNRPTEALQGAFWRDFGAVTISRTPSRLTVTGPEPSHRPGNLSDGQKGGRGGERESSSSLFLTHPPWSGSGPLSVVSLSRSAFHDAFAVCA